MYEALKADGRIGGFNLDAKDRRPSYTHADMFRVQILGKHRHSDFPLED